MPLGEAWQLLLETPLINFMVLLSVACFGSFGAAILLFTVITRVITFPLTLKTLHASRAMQELQPQLADIQKRYSDPKRRSEETMKLYRENGVNPIGCLGPMIVQFPIFIALYGVIRITLGNTPENVLYLSTRLYDFDVIRSAIPPDTTFLLLDLEESGNIPLALTVFVAMYLQQRISTTRRLTPDRQQNLANDIMLQFGIPLIFGYFLVLGFPAGLGLYWAASTIIGIILQWIFVGPGDFTWRTAVPFPAAWRSRAAARLRPRPQAQPASAATRGVTEARDSNASGGDERQDGRRGGGKGAGPARAQPRSSRRRRR
ncbi:MAG: YidC/Oxa1 family membrane protein insertase [Chloroflexi bacterium]|nr:YidC/Oxa1 family membrane protein insertase [Chloroflexota bacterium]